MARLRAVLAFAERRLDDEDLADIRFAVQTFARWVKMSIWKNPPTFVERFPWEFSSEFTVLLQPQIDEQIPGR